MSTTRTQERDLALGTALGSGDLPELTTIDRVALRLGLALILWGRRRRPTARAAEQADRAEPSRRCGSVDRAARARDAAFEHRRQAGPTW